MFSSWGAFRKGAEITPIIPDLDNASEGRENTRLRVTPELLFFPSVLGLTQTTLK